MTDFWEPSLLWGSAPHFPTHRSFPLSDKLMDNCWDSYKKRILDIFDLLLLPVISTEKIPVILYERELTSWPPPRTSRCSLLTLMRVSSGHLQPKGLWQHPSVLVFQYAWGHNTASFTINKLKIEKLDREKSSIREREGHTWSFIPMSVCYSVFLHFVILLS